MLINFFILLLELFSESAILYLALWGLKKGIKYLAEKKDNTDKVMFYFNLFIIFSWVVYTVYCIYSFADEYIDFSYVALAFLLLGYKFFVNIVLGVFYKLQKGYNLGLLMNIGGKEGTIYRYGYTSLFLESEDKDLFSIPYSTIYNETIIEPKLKKDFSLEVLEVTNEKCSNFKNDIFLLKKQILLLPEISVSRGVNVKYTDAKKGEVPTIRIEFGLVDIKNIESVKMKIKDILLK